MMTMPEPEKQRTKVCISGHEIPEEQTFLICSSVQPDGEKIIRWQIQKSEAAKDMLDFRGNF